MTSNDLNQIDDLLKKRLAESESRVMSEVGKYMEDEILPVLDSHSNALRSHTKILKEIVASSEQAFNNTQKLNKRTTEIENNLGIVPPPELTIIR